MKLWPLILIAFMVFSSGVFCAEPDTLESKRDGAWWGAATWDPERLPKAGNKVHIRSEHAVVFDAKSLNLIPFLHVEGSLVFARDRDTELNVAVFKVGGGREAHSGVADVHGHKTARIRLHSHDGPYSLTFSGLSGIPFIQLSDDNMNGKAETHVPNLKIEDRRDGNDDARRRPLVDMGGGKRTKDPVLSGLPVVGHDLFGAGKHAKFVSSRDVQYRKDKESYLDYNFVRWSVKPSGLKPGNLKLTALATDKTGNREQTTHTLMITIVQ
ncbi:MAG: hypothetical protein ACJAVK_000061 [Akkermansiaceae bacterium]|jgi:hypothetical protein